MTSRLSEYNLNPCPICGSADSHTIIQSGGQVSICCSVNDNGGCGMSGGYKPTVVEAVKAWTRKPDNCEEKTAGELGYSLGARFVKEYTNDLERNGLFFELFEDDDSPAPYFTVYNLDGSVQDDRSCSYFYKLRPWSYEYDGAWPEPVPTVVDEPAPSAGPAIPPPPVIPVDAKSLIMINAVNTDSGHYYERAQFEGKVFELIEPADEYGTLVMKEVNSTERIIITATYTSVGHYCI